VRPDGLLWYEAQAHIVFADGLIHFRISRKVALHLEPLIQTGWLLSLERRAIILYAKALVRFNQSVATLQYFVL